MLFVKNTITQGCCNPGNELCPRLTQIQWGVRSCKTTEERTVTQRTIIKSMRGVKSLAGFQYQTRVDTIGEQPLKQVK